ncbi:glycosyltransferase [Streptomyces xanthochromogenes]|uniref:glycosyltransferase n=1 Tax=Streptomyces xanthochromogenes TaxID=67384 RepID=UPI002F40B8E7
MAREVRDCGAAVPVVVCGRNETLAAQLRSDGIEHVYGWVDDMPGLMHASDVLIQNAGGLTSLEAFAAGLPVASYRCIPGHGLTNAAALDEAGAAVWIAHPADLKTVLNDLIDGPLGPERRAAGLALFARTAEEGPAGEIAREARAGLRRTAAPPGAPHRHRTSRRLAATAVVACAVWAGAVGTAVATSYGEPGLARAIGHGLDLDDFARHQGAHPQGHHS